MKKRVALILLVVVLVTSVMQNQAFAGETTFDTSFELSEGAYTLHEIYRSDVYWTTKEYDKQVDKTFTLAEAKTLYFSYKDGDYYYSYTYIYDERDGNTNIYVYYNDYN